MSERFATISKPNARSVSEEVCTGLEQLLRAIDVGSRQCKSFSATAKRLLDLMEEELQSLGHTEKMSGEASARELHCLQAAITRELCAIFDAAHQQLFHRERPEGGS